MQNQWQLFKESDIRSGNYVRIGRVYTTRLICRVLGAIATPAGSQETEFCFSLSRLKIDCISRPEADDRIAFSATLVLSFVS